MHKTFRCPGHCYQLLLYAKHISRVQHDGCNKKRGKTGRQMLQVSHLSLSNLPQPFEMTQLHTMFWVWSQILEHMNSEIKVKMWQSQFCTHYSTMKCGDECTISSRTSHFDRVNQQPKCQTVKINHTDLSSQESTFLISQNTATRTKRG